MEWKVIIPIMLFSGIILGLMMAAICDLWQLYAGFWERRLNNIERIQFAFVGCAFFLVAVGVLAWLTTFIGIILNVMYRIIL